MHANIGKKFKASEKFESDQYVEGSFSKLNYNCIKAALKKRWKKRGKIALKNQNVLPCSLDDSVNWNVVFYSLTLISFRNLFTFISILRAEQTYAENQVPWDIHFVNSAIFASSDPGLSNVTLDTYHNLHSFAWKTHASNILWSRALDHNKPTLPHKMGPILLLWHKRESPCRGVIFTFRPLMHSNGCYSHTHKLLLFKTLCFW